MRLRVRSVLGVADRDCERFERVDVHLCGRQGGLGRAVWEATWVQGVRGVERFLPDGDHDCDATEEHLCRGKEGEPGMLMLVVVPPEEGLEPAARVRNAARLMSSSPMAAPPSVG